MIPRLDRRMEIQIAADTVDAAGAPVVTYSTLATVWCSRVHMGGREFRAAGAVNAETTDIFIIRYRADVTTKHRLVFEAVNYDILDVGEGQGRRQLTQIQAKARAG